MPVKSGPVTRFVLIDTEQKTSRVFLERDTIGHPQFCPDDDDLILYAGPLTDRVWLTDRSGANNRRLYQREDKMQWVTHEVWVPGRRTVAFVDWPRGMRMIDVDRGVVRSITFPGLACGAGRRRRALRLRHQFPRPRPAHVRSRRRSGRRGASSSAPARRRRRASTGAGRSPTTTGRSRSKRASTRIRIRASAPDGSRVVFTSDKTGHAQIYEVDARRSIAMNGRWPARKPARPPDIRAGRITGTSRGLAHGFVQCNLAILPKAYAFDFLLYCQRNQRACPVLEVTDPGSRSRSKLAPGADLRTDCARYSVFVDGVRTGGPHRHHAISGATISSPS